MVATKEDAFEYNLTVDLEINLEFVIILFVLEEIKREDFEVRCIFDTEFRGEEVNGYILECLEKSGFDMGFEKTLAWMVYE